ncbi:MAG TPA: hypothetical protein PKA90_12440 [Ignavibacteria bacterium]|nr:hypothetical protein [Ignavibacteria bacterium]HMR41227.1 hypothetical protein [Ignavibacteria bacterium]
MKTKFSLLASMFMVITIALFLSGCGKKESTGGKGSSDSKTEESGNETKIEKADEKENNAGEVPKETTTTGSTDTDKMIDEYQDIVDEYVKLVKEMKNGNLSNVKDMQALAEKTQVWSKKLTSIAPTLTNAQQERLKKISKEAEDYLN